jgi:S-layer protein
MAVAADYTAVAEQLYIAYFGRPADRAGLINMTAALAAAEAPTNMNDFAAASKTNATVKALLSSFGGSTESAALYTGTDAQFIVAIYQNVLNRDPLLAGLDFWTNALSTGAMTRAEAAAQIMAAATKDGGDATDAATVANKTTVATNFTSAIDTAAEVIGYSGKVAAQTARDMLHTVDSTTDTTAFNATVATTLSAIVHGTVTSVTSNLTLGADIVATGSGDDIINGGTSATWSAFDKIDGGAGNDTMTVLLAATTAPGGTAVQNVETLNINATGAGFTIDSTGYTGLTSLNLSVATAGAVAVTAAATTSLAIAATGASDIDVVGGKGDLTISTGAGTVQVGATAAANAFTSVSVTGGTTVEIHDNATTDQDDGTALKTVTVNGSTGNVDISAAGLTTINATKLVTAGAVITNTDLDTAHALTLNLNGVDDSADGAATGGTITFVDGEATSVKVASTGTASYDVTVQAAKATAVTIAADEKLQLDALTAGLATSVAISGDSTLVVSAHTLAATAAITSTSTGAVTFTGAILAGQSYSGGSGVDTITLSASGTKAIATGAGNDVITYAGALATGGSIDAGTGTDTLVMTAAQAVTATGSTAFAGTVSNFEVLKLSAATGAAAAINMANADGINSLSIAGATVGALAVSNAAANFTLTQTALTSFASSVSLASDTGLTDNVNLVYSAADGFTSSAAITIANVEKLTITTTDADTTAQTAVIVTPLTATSAATVTVAGNMGISFIGGMTQTTLTSLDASGLTATGAFGGLTWTSGALAASSTIKGSAAGTNTVIFSAANTAGTHVTYTGGSGADTITGSNGLDNVVTLGNGTNSFTSVGAGNNTITGGTGVDTITVGTGANTISVGAGNDIVHIGASAGLNTVDVGTGTDTVVLDAIQTTSGFYTSVTGMAAGDVINLAAVVDGGTVSAQTAMGSKITLGGASSFTTYLNAATAGDGATANTIIKWFQFNGNTYVVEDTNAAATFQDGHDSVIELVGLVDLSNSTIASGVITIV